MTCVMLMACAPVPSDRGARDSYPQAGVTYLHWDKRHGYQVNYLDEGVAWLWYPGNGRALRESWSAETVGGQQFVCFAHPAGSFNPVTGTGGGRHCAPLAGERARVVAALPGDVFRLASGAVPYRLDRDRAPPEFGL